MMQRTTFDGEDDDVESGTLNRELALLSPQKPTKRICLMFMSS